MANPPRITHCKWRLNVTSRSDSSIMPVAEEADMVAPSPVINSATTNTAIKTTTLEREW